MIHRSLIRFGLATCAAVGLTAIAQVGVARADSGATVSTSTTQEVTIDSSSNVQVEVEQNLETQAGSQTAVDSTVQEKVDVDTEAADSSMTSTNVVTSTTTAIISSNNSTEMSGDQAADQSKNVSPASNAVVDGESSRPILISPLDTPSTKVSTFSPKTREIIHSTPVATLKTQRPMAAPMDAPQPDNKPVPVPVGVLHEITGTLMGIVMPSSAAMDALLASGSSLLTGLLSSNPANLMLFMSILTLMSLFVEYLRRAGFVAAPRGPQVNSPQFATLALMGLSLPMRKSTGSFFSGSGKGRGHKILTLHKKGGE